MGARSTSSPACTTYVYSGLPRRAMGGREGARYEKSRKVPCALRGSSGRSRKDRPEVPTRKFPLGASTRKFPLGRKFPIGGLPVGRKDRSASIGSRRHVRRAAVGASLSRLYPWAAPAGSPSHSRLSSGWTTRWRLSATGALRDEEEEEICTVPFEGCTCGRKGPGSRCSRRSRPRS